MCVYFSCVSGRPDLSGRAALPPGGTGSLQHWLRPGPQCFLPLLLLPWQWQWRPLPAATLQPAERGARLSAPNLLSSIIPLTSQICCFMLLPRRGCCGPGRLGRRGSGWMVKPVSYSWLCFDGPPLWPAILDQRRSVLLLLLTPLPFFETSNAFDLLVTFVFLPVFLLLFWRGWGLVCLVQRSPTPLPLPAVFPCMYKFRICAEILCCSWFDEIWVCWSVERLASFWPLL